MTDVVKVWNVGVEDARKAWEDFVYFGKILVTGQSVAAMISGIPSGLLKGMGQENVSLTMQKGPGENEWTFLKKQTGNPESSLQESYLTLLTALANEARRGQRPDQLADFQEVLEDSWEQLPRGIKTKLANEGKAPELLGQNLND